MERHPLGINSVHAVRENIDIPPDYIMIVHSDGSQWWEPIHSQMNEYNLTRQLIETVTMTNALHYKVGFLEKNR